MVVLAVAAGIVGMDGVVVREGTADDDEEADA